MNTMTPSVHPWAADSAPGVRFGLNTTVLPAWPATRAFVQTAEGLGFDALMLADHPLSTPSAPWTALARPTAPEPITAAG